MRIITVSGAILSFLTLGLIVQWTVNLYERDIEDLPLILALQDEMRVKPKDPGGEKVAFQGLSVNDVLDESQNEVNEVLIKLAPSEDNLLEDEINPPILLEEHDENTMAESISRALESLLGIESQVQNKTKENIELHIASYSTAEKANAHWFLLQQVNFDLLVNYNHQVVRVPDLEEDLFRLRVVGFDSIAAAQDMCARLIERGEKCVPSVNSND